MSFISFRAMQQIKLLSLAFRYKLFLVLSLEPIRNQTLHIEITAKPFSKDNNNARMKFEVGEHTLYACILSPPLFVCSLIIVSSFVFLFLWLRTRGEDYI